MNVESYKPFCFVDQFNEAYQNWTVSEVKQLQERSARHLNLADCFPIVMADMLNRNMHQTGYITVSNNFVLDQQNSTNN